MSNVRDDNYEGTDPCHEVRLEWRHRRIEYILRLIENLSKKERITLLNNLGVDVGDNYERD